MVWTIYCHTHISSGRKYVGLTVRAWQRRWSQHVTQSMKSSGGRSHFQNAIRLYGKSAFSHEVLETCDSLEDANAAENKWIEELGTRNPVKGFNLMIGGQHVPHSKKNPWDRPGMRDVYLEAFRNPVVREKLRSASMGKTQSQEARMKNSAAHKGKILNLEHRSKISLSLRGRSPSQKTREKISASMSGRTLSSETRAKISNTKKLRASGDVDRTAQ